jgi:phenylacetate-coenzyme A ligase PaaK-like adenylate-forming protein
VISSTIARLVYPRIPRVKRRWTKASEIGRTHHRSQVEIAESTQSRLAALLRHAAKHTVFYRKLFQERGWNPARAEEYWPEWPILTQELLQEHRDEILSDDAVPQNMVLDSSGGSSGLTKTFYRSRENEFHSGCAVAHSDEIAGWVPAARTAYLWGAPKDLGKYAGVSAMAMGRLRNTRWYDSFDMGEDRMAQYHRDLSRFRPEVIIAYAGSIHQMANFLRSRGVTASYPNRGIVTSAETLSEEMRSVIESVFPARAFNRYGSREVGLIAFECEAHSGMHVSVTNNVVEVVKRNSLEPVWEEEGEILVTTISEFSFPFIRYQIGDIGVLTQSPCECGRGSPRLSKVLGRSSDFITAGNGRQIHGEYFTHAFYGKEKIRQFLLVQSEAQRIDVQVVLNNPLTDQEEAEILREFCRVLGERTAVTIKPVDSIPDLPSGKRRFTVSRLAS